MTKDQEIAALKESLAVAVVAMRKVIVFTNVERKPGTRLSLIRDTLSDAIARLAKLEASK